jgi:hypothetical protein
VSPSSDQLRPSLDAAITALAGSHVRADLSLMTSSRRRVHMINNGMARRIAD